MKVELVRLGTRESTVNSPVVGRIYRDRSIRIPENLLEELNIQGDDLIVFSILHRPERGLPGYDFHICFCKLEASEELEEPKELEKPKEMV